MTEVLNAHLCRLWNLELENIFEKLLPGPKYVQATRLGFVKNAQEFVVYV
jgi:hypothetical protein